MRSLVVVFAACAGCAAPADVVDDAACADAAGLDVERAVMAAVLLPEITDAPFAVLEETQPADASAGGAAVLVDDLVARSDRGAIGVDDGGYPGVVFFVDEGAVRQLTSRDGITSQQFALDHGTSTIWSVSRPGLGCGRAVIDRGQVCGALCGRSERLTLAEDDADDGGGWSIVDVVSRVQF